MGSLCGCTLRHMVFCRHSRKAGRTLSKKPTLTTQEHIMNGIIYMVGLIVIVMAILSFAGLR